MARFSGRNKGRARVPYTFLVGLSLILTAEILLIMDVSARGGAIVPYDPLPPSEGGWLHVARFVALSLTPLCWIGALLVLDGLLQALTRRKAQNSSPKQPSTRQRPRRFALCVMSSVPIWLFFDWVNFSFLGAWDYHGLPESFLHRNAAYLFSFAAICPAMFLFAEVYQRFGLRALDGPTVRIAPAAQSALVLLGAVCLAFPFIVQSPLGTLTLWFGWLFFLDPINERFGAPSLLRDLRNGWWDRVASLMISGMTCGLLWEFWNYWATAKWTYDLPFLGSLEEFRYFEMPVLGMFGFPFFALECWVMFQTVVLAVEKLTSREVEPLPSRAALL